MLVFYAELRGGKATLWVNLLSVNEDFEGKRNTENLCKRVKCKVYFAILQRVLPNFGYQICFLVTPLFIPPAGYLILFPHAG